MGPKELVSGQYRKPMYIGISVAIIGNIFYALAYHVHNLYFILLGRLICGIAFTNFLYNKRYCSDARIVGIRRRTQLAGLLVVGQGLGFSAGPFLGGLLYKVGFSNDIFNGYTSPGWIMALVWFVFLLISIFTLEDVPPHHAATEDIGSVIELREDRHHEQVTPVAQDSLSENRASQTIFRMTPAQWGVVVCMSWQSFTCFFILGGWEANIPVYTGSTHPFYYSPFAAGNFIALGGLASFPLLFLNVIVARSIQDRRILATGSGLGLAGLLIMLATLATSTVSVGSFFVCWFLIALGFNLSSTVTTSLLSKQVPPEWNLRMALVSRFPVST
jgi:MFS family permease